MNTEIKDRILKLSSQSSLAKRIGISLRAIAKKRKCSDGTIRKELQTAMGFVEGVYSMLT